MCQKCRVPLLLVIRIMKPLTSVTPMNSSNAPLTSHPPRTRKRTAPITIVSGKESKSKNGPSHVFYNLLRLWNFLNSLEKCSLVLHETLEIFLLVIFEALLGNRFRIFRIVRAVFGDSSIFLAGPSPESSVLCIAFSRTIFEYSQNVA